MSKQVQKWWDETAHSYQESSAMHTRSAHYGPYAPDENELKLLGNVRGKHVLEIGCGAGQCSIAFAKQGAKCIGIDISKEQLKFAAKLAKKNRVNVEFIKGTFQSLRATKSSSQDIVFSAYALQYSPDLNKVFAEVYRVLKRKGIFVFSFDHPFYLIIDKKTHKVKHDYYATGKLSFEQTWADKTKHTFVFYHRKLSDIYNALVESKLAVEKIIEPHKTKNQPAWTKGKWKKIYPKSLVKLIGPTIIFRASKK